jgi:hypothetical protein
MRVEFKKAHNDGDTASTSTPTVTSSFRWALKIEKLIRPIEDPP